MGASGGVYVYRVWSFACRAAALLRRVADVRLGMGMATRRARVGGGPRPGHLDSQPDPARLMKARMTPPSSHLEFFYAASCESAPIILRNLEHALTYEP